MKLLIAMVWLVGFAAFSDPLFDTNGLSLSIGGNGSVTSATSVLGLNLGVAQTGTCGLPFQVGVRQMIEYSKGIGSVFGTELFYNATLFTLFDKLDVAAGLNVGSRYGEHAVMWTVSPEAGIRWWMSPKAALLWRVEYPFDLVGFGSLRTLNYFMGFQVRI